MTRSSRFGVVAVVLLVMGGMGSFGGVDTAGAAQPYVAIQSVTVTPENPEVNDTVTLTTQITNFESSPDPAQISEVALRSDGGTIAVVDDVGTIGSGGTVEVPLSTTFDTPGPKQLTVLVSGRNPSGAVFNLRSTVTVSVQETREVQLSLSTADTPAIESAVNVTIANGKTDNVSNLQLVLSGQTATVKDPRRVKAVLESGQEHVEAYDVTFEDSGAHPLTAALTFRDQNGNQQRVSESMTFAVDEAVVDAELDAEVIRNGSGARVDATLTNFGNVPLKDVQIRGESDGETVARALVPDVGIESAQTLSISESSLPAGDIRLMASFEAAGEQHETATTIAFTPSIDGNITLTGIEVTDIGGSITLAGSASNVGETAVTGTVVEVVDSEAVNPVPPAQDYFVGNVPAGEFTSFELTAQTAGNRTDEIPVRVSYIADGERHTRVVDVTISDAGGPVAIGGRPGDGGDDGPGEPRGPFSQLGQINPMGILLQLGAIIVVIGGAVYWWRNRSNGDAT